MEPISYEWLDHVTKIRDGLARFIPSPDGEAVLIVQVAQSDNRFYLAATHTIRQLGGEYRYIEPRPSSIQLRDRQHLRDIYRALFGVPLKEC